MTVPRPAAAPCGSARLPPWRDTLTHALSRAGDDPGARCLQLATVRADGRPANRTVVFRGFDAESGLRVTTDARHRKVAHLARTPWAEACWYLAAVREQFRLLGRVQVLGPGVPDRDAAWRELSPSTRAQFAWPEPGAAPRAADAAFRADPSAAERPPAAFTLLVLRPVRVDHLVLAHSPHRRQLHALRGGRWSVTEINP